MDGLIASILSVHYISDKFLIVIVDDGSNDPVNEEALNTRLVKSYPLKVIRLSNNSGITVALNTGLQWIYNNCDTAYIARLDAGDTCDSERFYIQVNEMRQHSDAILCGSWCKFLSKKTNISYLYKTPVDSTSIRKEMYFRNVFIHPTVMFKKDVITLIGLYPDDFPHTEDYAYFWRMLKAGNSIIIPKILTICEMNEKGISLTNRRAQIQARQQVVKKFGVNPYLKVLGIIKLWMLLIIPNTLILRLKQLAR